MIESLDFVQNMFKHEANAVIGQHVFYYQTYMPPRYLVNVQLGKSESEQNQIYDMMSSISYNNLEKALEDTYRNISKINDEKKNLAFFLITPSINDRFTCRSERVKFHLIYQFYFSIQFESLKNYADLLFCNYETCNYKCNDMGFIERLFFTFTLNLYQFIL